MNGLGATLRAGGRLELAARALEHAAAGLAAAGLSLDEGAARYNLGLVLRESGRREKAAAAFERAAELFDPSEVPAQAAAGNRELGATRLELGQLDAAEPALEEAVALADRAGDVEGRGAAANTLGLARLARGDAASAAEAFSAAVAANPRSLRPETFAMAQANLALARERTGEAPRARLAARQALSVPVAADAVRAQATAVLERLGRGSSDLREVLEAEAPEARERLVREELARTVDRGAEERAADMSEWIDTIAATDLDAAEIAELWLGGLLELPVDALEALVRSMLEALADRSPDDREAVRDAVSRAMGRFHVPQWMRLQDVFSEAAGAVGDPGPWR